MIEQACGPMTTRARVIAGLIGAARREGNRMDALPSQHSRVRAIMGSKSWPSAEDHRSEGRNMGNIVTRFTERFGCKHPFSCAGMAFAGMTDLALAVCRGGGVGAIGVGLMPAEQLRAMIHEMRKQTTAPFNVNLITFFDKLESGIHPAIQMCTYLTDPAVVPNAPALLGSVELVEYGDKLTAIEP